MNRFTLVVLGFAASTSLAATPIDETLDADGARLLDIENVTGRVTVTGSDAAEVHVSGSLSDSANGLDVRRDGSRIIVHVQYPEHHGNQRFPEQGSTLEISAPRGLDVSVDTVSANIAMREMHGEQDLSSVSGSIDTTVFAAEIRARTVSGNIVVDGNDAQTRAEIASVSGGVEIDSFSGEVNSQTVSGGIDLRSEALDRAELKSVSGSIAVDARMSHDGRLRAVTTSGRISLDLNDSPAGRYEVSSFSGAVKNCFGPAGSRSRFGPPSTSLQFEEPDADMQISAQSMSGSIEICR